MVKIILPAYVKKTALLGVALVLWHGAAAAEPRELTLEESISLAMAHNPAMQIAAANQEKAVWAVGEAQAAKGVSVDYTHTEMRSTAPLSWMPTLAAVSPYNYFSNKISASVPLYTGGKLESVVAQAKLGKQVSDLELQTTRQQLKLDTTVEYFEVLRSGKLLDVARRTENDFALHLKQVRQMYEEGVAAWRDVLQTKVRLANAENSRVQAENTYQLSQYTLNKRIGLPLHGELKLQEPAAKELPQESMAVYVEQGVANRPEMAQSQAGVVLAKEKIKEARSGQQPSLALTGSTAWDDDEAFGGKNRDWTAMLVVQLNLFDSGATQAKLKQAKAGETAAREEERQTKDAISLEISDAHLRVQEALKRIEATRTAVEEAQSNFNISRESYAAGVGTNLDVMDAEVALQQAQTNYIQAAYDLQISRARLEKAVGPQK